MHMRRGQEVSANPQRQVRPEERPHTIMSVYDAEVKVGETRRQRFFVGLGFRVLASTEKNTNTIQAF